MKKLLKTILLISISLLVFGCDVNSPLSLAFSPPNCKLIELERTDYSPGNFTSINFKATNVSDPIAYSVGCTVKIKKGNTIIDRGSAYFGTLEPGESSIDDAHFVKIKTHDDYDYVEITLSWYDANNEYYEKSY